MGFKPHSIINTNWISILAGHHCVGSCLRFSFVDRRKKDSFVYLVTFGRGIVVALCMVCLEAWLNFRMLKPTKTKTPRASNGSFALVAVRSH